MVYGGRIYRAKWWTQGEKPGQADVWLDTGTAAAATPAPETAPTPVPNTGTGTAASSDFKVVAYYPSWKRDTGKLDFQVLTHVVYAFAIPTAEGGLRPLENADQVAGILRSAHSAGAKVLLGVGGWSYNDVPLEGTFLSATSTQERSHALVEAIVSMCNAYGFDGVDMDWEHPRVDGSSAGQYQRFMPELAERLHSQGKVLSSAVLSGVTPDGNIYYDAAAHSDAVLAAVDWINVMAYDGGDGERHSSYSFAAGSGRYWRTTRGLPAHKVVLGVPFYARPSWASYENILAAVPDAYQKDHVTYNGMDAWYNGVDTIKKKTRFAMQELGGVMIWEVTQDTADRSKSLLQAIGQALRGG